MKSRKKNLIEALHGSFMFVDNLPDLISKESIYDENGIVDSEFLSAILEWMSKMSEVSNKVSESLGKLLGIDDTVNEKKKQSDEGKKWDVEEILKHCTLESNVLKLPAVNGREVRYRDSHSLLIRNVYSLS